MHIYPAIDILAGRAVRLKKGMKAEITDYGRPLDRAILWKSKGAKRLHVVDLDGAFDGAWRSGKIITEIIKKTKLFVQTGGGIRTLSDVKLRMSSGVDRVIIGTAAVQNPEMLEQAVKLYGDKIAVGIDVKDGFVAIKGWVEKTKIELFDFAKKIKDLGVSTVIYTDISRDGVLTGIDIENSKKLQEQTGLNIIASGGIKDIDEVKRLKRENIYGVILGRSIYEKTMNLSDAVMIGENSYD